MKLFGYYALHSFKNQLKKLFKTWVLIFFVACFVLGGIIGFGASSLEDAANPEGPDSSQEQPPTEEEVPPEEVNIEEAYAVAELMIGGIILATFVFICMGADKNGSKIFLPADVNLLFASPMKPQSVLLFRLMTQLGVVILSSIYLGFQIPNLVLELGLSIWSAVGIMATWLLTLASGKLLQILLYTVASTKTGLKKYLRWGIYGFVLVLAAGYYVFVQTSGLDYYGAAKAFFNGSFTRLIPLWGWLKGLAMYSIEGNLLGALASAAAVVAGGAGLAALIWRLPADFYEDAMAKSQETAELLETAQAEKSTGFVRRKKDRSEKLCRDQMRGGWGATVFFHRAMYNRFRFAHFGVFTKTSETYLVAATAVGCLCQFVIGVDGTLPVVLTLAVFAFFRSLGNPLLEDTGKDFFRMIPEPTGTKLFYSVLGGTANCFLDMIPALVLTAILCGGNPVILLAWAIFIASIDFYGTNVGAFIDLSVPVAAGKTIKQVVQIMFIYFGLLPDVAIMAVGIVFGQVALAAVGAAVVNLGLGFLFLALCPLFLDPKEQPVKILYDQPPEEKKLARKRYSRLGWGCATILLTATALQLLCMEFLPKNAWTMWLYTFGPIYLVAMPLGLLVLRSVPKAPIPKSNLGFKGIVTVVFISLFTMYGGNFLATFLMSLFGGLNPETGLTDFVMADSWLMKILVMVVLAPCLEEFIFRKQLIDRMHSYGGKVAVVTSALLFGLFHGNFAQFVYASALGLVLGFVYLKTGKLRYTIGLHMFVNFLGGIVSSWLLENLDLEALEDPNRVLEAMASPAFLAYVCFLLFILASMVTGLVLLCCNARKVRFAPGSKQLGKGKWSIAWGNPGMIVFAALCLLSIVMALLA